jgi:hypothetical protein
MIIQPNKYLSFIFSMVCILGLLSCGGGGGGSSSGGVVPTGTASVALVDSASEDYAAVYVTIRDIQFHLGGNENSSKSWRSIQQGIDYPVTVNLLELVNGVRLDLGIVELPAGHHTQMRLILDEVPEQGTINILSQAHPFANYVIIDKDPNDAINPVAHELKVPSGDKTGVKIVGGYYISANQTTELILDFDACRSVVQAGSSGQWHLKPTIKFGETPDYSIIKGKVIDGAGGIEGVLVKAQQFNASVPDEEDEVIVTASTLTDINGDYSLFVEPGVHNIVAFMDGYSPGVNRVEVLAGGILNSADFNLIGPAASKTISGRVIIPTDGSELQYATLSFRQEVGGVTCTACVAGEKVEIKTVNVANGNGTDTDFNVSLPVDTYQLVSSTFGFDTLSNEINLIVDSGPHTEDVIFY